MLTVSQLNCWVSVGMDSRASCHRRTAVKRLARCRICFGQALSGDWRVRMEGSRIPLRALSCYRCSTYVYSALNAVVVDELTRVVTVGIVLAVGSTLSIALALGLVVLWLVSVLVQVWVLVLLQVLMRSRSLSML